MGKLTLEEAIAHAKEIAAKNYTSAKELFAELDNEDD